MKLIIVSKTFFININNLHLCIVYYLMDKTISFINNSEFHRKDGPAIVSPIMILWYYKGKFYGGDDVFTNYSWKKKVKKLKREEKLRIFK